jgi:hypothetical protein
VPGWERCRFRPGLLREAARVRTIPFHLISRIAKAVTSVTAGEDRARYLRNAKKNKAATLRRKGLREIHPQVTGCHHALDAAKAQEARAISRREHDHGYDTTSCH